MEEDLMVMVQTVILDGHSRRSDNSDFNFILATAICLYRRV